jgi:hypothetical protein
MGVTEPGDVVLRVATVDRASRGAGRGVCDGAMSQQARVVLMAKPASGKWLVAVIDGAGLPQAALTLPANVVLLA